MMRCLVRIIRRGFHGRTRHAAGGGCSVIMSFHLDEGLPFAD